MTIALTIGLLLLLSTIAAIIVGRCLRRREREAYLAPLDWGC
jgi:hypothetical protein